MYLTGIFAALLAVISLATATSIVDRQSTTGAAPPAAVTGFITTSGQNFQLDGEVYTVVGANSYWVGLTGLNSTEMDQAFADIAATGATTVRTWGFNDVTTPNGDYYQLWTNGTPTLNYGPTGLENFDNVVAAAKAYGLRLIVALTNNWSDYGGMDVYVSQLTGTDYHDYFYTNSDVIQAYKNYVSAFVSRYVDEPGIMAWELANEPRCAGSTGTTSGNCTAVTVTSWIAELSEYIHSFDDNHLVGIGDEGWYAIADDSDYPYGGGESIGINFTANLAIPTIDFGTAHVSTGNSLTRRFMSLPHCSCIRLSWGETTDPTEWGAEWIENHAASQKAQNKPVILEEFGITTNMTATYEVWYPAIINSGLTGDLIWQAGSYLASGPTPNDGYSVYPNDTVYGMETTYAAELKARNAASQN
ncbi:glycoside hydrolase family 5 protein [Daedalea quercina L-15889]|uniref:mannan endo-1,4-beta-mannosidase n=1 Tax=Daedalea quercina L-15889 TaxID=1314783 RepID=A0A165SLV0_9APHY|nr:glycoside hydrolase family 5 protein [Daedalea quercina L-15889]